MDSNENFSTFADLRAKIPLKSILSFILFGVITFISFGELRLSSEGIVAVTGWTVILYITGIILYNDAYSSAKDKAIQSSAWENVCRDHSKLVNVIRAGFMLDRLEEFCRSVRTTIRKRLIRSRLVGTGVDAAEFEKSISKLTKKEIWALCGKDGKPYPRKVRARLLAATLVPDPRIYPEDLLHEAERAEKALLPLGMDGSERERRDKWQNIISRALTSAVGGWLTVDFIANLSLSTFGIYLMRIFPLIMAIVIGNRKGNENIYKISIQHKKRQISYLEDFLATNQSAATEEISNVKNLPVSTAASGTGSPEPDRASKL